LVQVDYGWTPAPLHFFARYDAERSARIVADAAQVAVVISAALDP